MRIEKHYGLIAKIGGSMLAVSVLAIALATVLNALRFEETYKRLVAQRLDVAVQDVGRALEVGLDLGLPIEDQDNLPDALRKHLAMNPEIQSIVVHACDGRPVIREDRGTSSGEPWRDHPGQMSWFAVRDDGISTGISVSDSLGACAAGVAVTQSAKVYLTAMATVSRQFQQIGLAAAGIAGVAMVAAAFVFGRRRRALQKIDDDFAQIVSGTAIASTPPIAAGDACAGWERDVVTAYLAARPEIVAHAAAGRGERPN